MLTPFTRRPLTPVLPEPGGEPGDQVRKPDGGYLRRCDGLGIHTEPVGETLLCLFLREGVGSISTAEILRRSATLSHPVQSPTAVDLPEFGLAGHVRVPEGLVYG